MDWTDGSDKALAQHRGETRNDRVPVGQTTAACTEQHPEQVCEVCGECCRCAWHEEGCDAIN